MAAAKSSAATSEKNIWDIACRLELDRTSPCKTYTGPIDPGVNYFVLMLEQLGAKTSYSCEGHQPNYSKEPFSFYISFSAPLRVALMVRECGFFAVELEGKNLWSLRRTFNDIAAKETCFRLAADCWENCLGPSRWYVSPTATK